MTMQQLNFSPISWTLLVSICVHGALWYNLSLPGTAYSYPEQSQTIEISLLPKMSQPPAVTPPQQKIVARAVTPTVLKPASQQSSATVKSEPVTEPDTTPAATQTSHTEMAQPEAPRYNARYLNNPPPAYPLAARRRNIEGRIVVHAEVQADGSCSQVELKTPSTSDILNQAALDAVKKWRFVPARLDGELVVAWVEIPITFKLDN